MKKEKIYISILLIIPFIFLVVLFLNGNMFGSYVDFMNQHTSIPEYFRKLFYTTYDFFPNFAFNLGSGQNIFNFSYYFLFNPLILLSYLLPFISMVNFMMTISFINILICPLLVYKWLKAEGITPFISFITSITFLFCSPFIFHSHRHLMFVNYFPFLLLSFFGVNRMMDNKKSDLLILSVVLIIITSFYYSIPSILCIVLYIIYKYIKKNKKIKLSNFIKDNFKNILPILVGILICSFYLLPTFASLFNGRNNNSIDISTLFISFSLENLTYSSYSLGFTAISFVAIIYYLFSKNKGLKTISVTLLILLFIPLFMYLLNGGLYARAKILIPFVFLVCLLIGHFLNDLFKYKVNIKHLILPILISCILTILNTSNTIFLLEMLITIIFIWLFLKYKHKIIIILPHLIIVIFTFISANLKEEYIKYKEYDLLMSFDKQNEIIDVLNEDNDIFRFNNLISSEYSVNYIYDSRYYQTSIYSSSYSDLYHNFYFNVFKGNMPYDNLFMMGNFNNILFDSYMGVKYFLSDYELSYDKKSDYIYENKNAYPLIYSSDRLINNEEFYSLSYPLSTLYLMNNVIISGNSKNVYKPSYRKIDISSLFEDKIEKENDKYILNVTEKLEFTIDIIENEGILFLDIENIKPLHCDDYDLEITINNVKNKLGCSNWLYYNNNTTFHYVLDNSKLDIKVNPGKYEFDDIKLYTASTNDVYMNNYDTFTFDTEKTKGDIIKGSINVTNDGYLVTSIPYDKGFSVYVDGQKTAYEIVNTAFIGFPIKEGKYTIEFKYESPFFKEGIIISFGTLVILSGYFIVKRRKKLHN